MLIAIVDDLKHEATALEAILIDELKKLNVNNYSISLFTSGEMFLYDWQPGKYSLIFLDIFIGDTSGVDLAKRIRETDDTASLIFFTTSNEFAYQSYEVGASYYLQKPVDREKIASMLSRLNMVHMEQTRFMELPDRTRILISDILYTEKFKHSLTIALANKESKTVSLTHQEAADTLLSHPEFCVIGQGTIINFNHVTEMMDKGFLMSDGNLITIPRRKYKEMKDAYYQYRFKTMLRGGSL